MSMGLFVFGPDINNLLFYSFYVFIKTFIEIKQTTRTFILQIKVPQI